MKQHSIGQTIATLRRARGWTQLELAKKLQVSDKAVSKWEKDTAYPSVEFFPVLAELFGVTIDYLMTGKIAEKEIVLMSKMEYCAKNDDAEMFQALNFSATDEDGNTIVTYAKQYESRNVIRAIIQKYGFGHLVPVTSNSRGRYDIKAIGEALYYAVLTNTFSELITKYQDNKHSPEDGLWKRISSLTLKDMEHPIYQKVFNLLISEPQGKEKICQFLFGRREKEIVIPTGYNMFEYIPVIWRVGIEFLFEKLLELGKLELFDQVVDYLERSNATSKNALQEMEKYDRRAYDYQQVVRVTRRQNPLLSIPQNIITKLIELVELTRAERAHQLNLTYGLTSIDADVLRVAKLKASNKLSDTELAVQACIHGGLLNISELLMLENDKVIQKALFTYPVHEFEMLCMWMEKKDIDALVSYGVDDAVMEFANKVMQEEMSMEFSHKYMIRHFWKASGPNTSELYYYQGREQVKLFDQVPKTLQEACHMFRLSKDRILASINHSQEKKRIIGELTREYYEALLEKGDTDMATIKLCVRLEAVLKYDLRYTGDFTQMLDWYCREWLPDVCDDWDDYVEENPTKKLLKKLLMKRNQIVHGGQTEATLSFGDLRACIDYICQMGE